MTDKQYASWVAMLLWCKTHPGQRGALVTPEGTYNISFQPKASTPEEEDIRISYVGGGGETTNG